MVSLTANHISFDGFEYTFPGPMPVSGSSITLVSLLLLAVLYMPVVVLAILRRCGQEGTTEETRIEPTKRGVEIIVSDTGVGWDPDIREIIFTKFYQHGDLKKHSASKNRLKAVVRLGISALKGYYRGTWRANLGGKLRL